MSYKLSNYAVKLVQSNRQQARQMFAKFDEIVSKFEMTSSSTHTQIILLGTEIENVCLNYHIKFMCTDIQCNKQYSILIRGTMS